MSDTDEEKQHVALYARVSTEMQAEEGLSIPAQLEEMREFAARKGWTIVREFVDPGDTGQTLERPALRELLAAVEGRAFDVVLVHELSRLSRSSVYDTFAIFEDLGRHEVGFAAVKEPEFDLSTPAGRLHLTFIAAINQYYIDILRLHTKKSKRQRAREGLYNASITPYGYRHVGDARTPPEIVEEEAGAVRLIFEKYATGDYTYLDLARLLNEEGFRTRAGRRFSKGTVADMMRNPFYEGYVVYREGRRDQTAGEIYPGKHEAIVSEELWDAVQKVRQRRHHASSRTAQRQRRPYLLSRIAHCHVCGRRLRVQSATSGGFYYREMSYSRGFEDCSNAQVGSRADPLHEQIGAIVRLLRLPPDWQDELRELIGEETEVATLQNRRARLVARRRRLKEAYIQGDFVGDEDVDIYRRELERIRWELAQFPSEDELLQIDRAAEVVESLAETWDEVDAEDRRDLVRLMLREVRVDVAQSRVHLLRPLVPFIPLFRAIPLVEEREFGVFAPVWPVDVGDSLPYPSLSPVTALPEVPVALPFLPLWPWRPDSSGRISPALSEALKARRQAGLLGGAVVSVPRPGVPAVRLDERKWPEVALETLSLEQALEQPNGSLAFLATPMAIQEDSDRGALADQVYCVLEQEGYWHLVDVLPASMPGHWVFRFFVGAWTVAQRAFWNARDFYNVLRESGYQVQQEEHTFHEPVTLGVALEIARRRDGLLARLPNEVYGRGLQRLEEGVEEQGAETLVSSEVTLVLVEALKGEERKRRLRRRRMRVDKLRK